MTFRLPINFCTQCGAPTVLKIPVGEIIARAVCERCEFVHYQNPRIITCALATNDAGEILLAKRDIEPRRHLWTLPGGFMELEESVEESAQREMEEETFCKVRMGRILAMISVPAIGQVHLMFHATLIHYDPRPTAESQEVQCFSPEAIPWENLAFHTVKYTLTHYLESPYRLLIASITKDRSLSVLGKF